MWRQECFRGSLVLIVLFRKINLEKAFQQQSGITGLLTLRHEKPRALSIHRDYWTRNCVSLW